MVPLTLRLDEELPVALLAVADDPENTELREHVQWLTEQLVAFGHHDLARQSSVATAACGYCRAIFEHNKGFCVRRLIADNLLADNLRWKTAYMDYRAEVGDDNVGQ